MLIECPVRTAEEAEILLDSGADILYGAPAGDFFGDEFQVVSRRPWPECNILSLRELIAIIQLTRKKRKKFYLAFNEHFYRNDQLNKIASFLKKNTYVHSVIAADLGLILMLRKELPRLKIILSVGTHIFNSAALRFYAGLGVEEVVFPREIIFSELKVIKRQFPEVKFSYIIKNDDCPNIDGMCSYSHGLYDVSGPCTDLFHITCHNTASGSDTYINDYNFRSRQNCKACRLQELAASIDVVKIAGRGASLRILRKDLSFIVFCRSVLRKSQAEYLVAVKEKFLAVYGQDCFFCQYASLSE